jgi:hypothetical protein
MKIKNFLKKINTALAIILLIIIASVLLIPKKLTHEGFEDIARGFTSETLYRDSKDIKKYDNLASSPSFMDTIDDKHDELIMNRCYQFTNAYINDLIDGSMVNPCATRLFTIVTNNFMDVKNKFFIDIQTVHDTIIKGPIQGPVYVLIYQVPYYKDAQGKDISLQAFNVSGYDFQPSHDDRNPNGNIQIYYKVLVIYGKYKITNNNTWQLQTSDLFAAWKMSWDNSLSSFEPQCFMKGVGNTDGPNKYAGCSSSNGKGPSMNTTSTCFRAQSR